GLRLAYAGVVATGNRPPPRRSLFLAALLGSDRPAGTRADPLTLAGLRRGAATAVRTVHEPWHSGPPALCPRPSWVRYCAVRSAGSPQSVARCSMWSSCRGGRPPNARVLG